MEEISPALYRFDDLEDIAVEDLILLYPEDGELPPLLCFRMY